MGEKKVAEGVVVVYDSGDCDYRLDDILYLARLCIGVRELARGFEREPEQ